MILKSSFIDLKDHIDWIEPIIIDQTRNKQHTYEVDLNELSTFIATFLLYGHFFKWEVHKKYKLHIFSLISLYRSYSSFVIYQNIHPSVYSVLMYCRQTSCTKWLRADWYITFYPWYPSLYLYQRMILHFRMQQTTLDVTLLNSFLVGVWYYLMFLFLNLQLFSLARGQFDRQETKSVILSFPIKPFTTSGSLSKNKQSVFSACF